MSEFVILFHQMPDDRERMDHWDLMIQFEQSLITWALDSPPIVGTVASGVRLEDHRIEYLDFEGSVSGNRGNVRQVARGRCQWIACLETQKKVRLFGADFVWWVTIDESNPQSVAVRFESCSDQSPSEVSN